MSGRDWVTSEESNMSSKNMSKKIMESMNKGFENFTPRPQYEVIKVEEESNKLITHKLTGY